MDLADSNSARDYLRKRLGKKVFKNLRQDRQRLERNYNVNFRLYYGDIDKNTYDSLMDTLEGFIRIRFKGKTSKHTALNRWEHYKNTSLENILAKNASLFVLMREDTPLAISLCYHYNNILFTAITSFDTEFQRYSLGRQMFYKQIEWCYENDYRLIDMGWGDFDYKVKFSNAVYEYENHVIYHKGSHAGKIMAHVIIYLLMVKYYLVMVKYKKFKRPKNTFKNRWLRFKSQ